jgi:glycerol-3-phosphate acyltransferase PlsY
MLAVVTTTVTIIVVAALGYLLGSIPVAVTVATHRGVRDPRTVGDGNPGLWNMRELYGDEAAAPVLVGDVVKGIVAAAIGLVLGGSGDWWIAYVGGGAAMLGHAWPLFAGFRGGRSVLTFVGAALVCAPVPAILAIIVTALMWGWRRELAAAARAGVTVFPFLQLLTEGWRRTAVTGILMSFIGLRFASAAITERRRAARARRSGGRSR